MSAEAKTNRPHVEITVVDARGSAPREPGAAMRWFPDGSIEETIGGGNLEQKALDEARTLWNDPERRTAFLEMPLSAKLGQCCGGHVRLFLKKYAPPHQAVICGAGHVSTALARILASTPVHVVVVDSRGDWADPARFPANVEVVQDDPDAYVRELKDAAERTMLLIMTHEHPLDEELCRLALRYPFMWIGLIGSRTKWLRFRQRLKARGFADEELNRITSPIGNKALGRTPEEIAVGVSAQLLAIYHGAEQAAEASGVARETPGRRGALILAGGAGRRMGGRWKGGLEIDGKPLAAAHEEIFRQAGAEICKVVYPEIYQAEAERIVGPGRRIVNPAPEASLFNSLQIGLREMIREAPDLDSLLVAPVDMVPLDEDWIAAMWDRHETLDAWATRPCVKLREGEKEVVRHGHPVILGHRLFATLLAADPETARLDFLLRDLPDDRKAEFELPDAAPLTNLNTPEDVADARAG